MQVAIRHKSCRSYRERVLIVSPLACKGQFWNIGFLPVLSHYIIAEDKNPLVEVEEFNILMKWQTGIIRVYRAKA